MTCPEVNVEGICIPGRAADAGGVPRRAALRVLQHVPRSGGGCGVLGETLPQCICCLCQSVLLCDSSRISHAALRCNSACISRTSEEAELRPSGSVLCTCLPSAADRADGTRRAVREPGTSATTAKTMCRVTQHVLLNVRESEWSGRQEQDHDAIIASIAKPAVDSI